jgi:hypothetical protein
MQNDDNNRFNFDAFADDPSAIDVLNVLTTVGFTKEDLGLYVGTRQKLMGTYYNKEVCGVVLVNDEVKLRARFSIYDDAKYDKIMTRIKIEYLKVVAYFKMLAGKSCIMNAVNVVPFILCMAQREGANISFQKNVFYISDQKWLDKLNKVKDIKLPVILGAAVIEPPAREYLLSKGARRVDLTPNEAGSVLYSSAAIYKLKSNEAKTEIDFIPNQVPDPLVGFGKGIVEGCYDVNTIRMLHSAIRKHVKLTSTPKDLVDLLLEFLNSVNKDVDQAKHASFVKSYSILNQNFVQFNKFVTESMGLKFLLHKMHPGKKCASIVETFDCAYKRLGSAMKFIPPLMGLFGIYSATPYAGVKDIVDYYGAAGLAHVRAISCYCSPRLYDIQATIVKEPDYTKGKYRIDRRDFFVSDDSLDYGTVAIIDIFDPARHAYDISQLDTAADPGMHNYATAFMRGMIFTSMKKNDKGIPYPHGNPHPYTSAIIKGRLPVTQYQHLYDDCYPFLVYCTGGLMSEEVYFVKIKDWTQQHYIARSIFVSNTLQKVGSTTMELYQAVITDRTTLNAWVIKIYCAKISFAYNVLQIPIMSYNRPLVMGMYRDWPIYGSCMPVCYGDKTIRHLLPRHIGKLLTKYDLMTASASEEMSLRFAAIYEDLQNEQKKDPSSKPPVDESEPPSDNPWEGTTITETYEEGLARMKNSSMAPPPPPPSSTVTPPVSPPTPPPDISSGVTTPDPRAPTPPPIDPVTHKVLRSEVTHNFPQDFNVMHPDEVVRWLIYYIEHKMIALRANETFDAGPNHKLVYVVIDKKNGAFHISKMPKVNVKTAVAKIPIFKSY